MSPGRDRSPGPLSAAPRMLRIEYKGQPYDWFNLDEMGDIVRTNDFSSTLRENITHYFGVPFEHQAIYDEEGLLSSMLDFSRALRSVKPWLRVYDAREMTQDLKEITTKQLEEIATEVMRSQRSLTSSGWGRGKNVGATDTSVGSTQLAQKSFASPRRNGQRDPSPSLADAVKSASDLVMDYNSAVNNLMSGSRNRELTPFQGGSERSLPSTAFPWSKPAVEAYTPQAAGLASMRFPTPPPGGQSFGQAPIGAWGSRAPLGAAPMNNAMPMGFPAQACRQCGNSYMCDALFCRKCGAPREAPPGRQTSSFGGQAFNAMPVYPYIGQQQQQQQQMPPYAAGLPPQHQQQQQQQGLEATVQLDWRSALSQAVAGQVDVLPPSSRNEVVAAPQETMRKVSASENAAPSQAAPRGATDLRGINVAAGASGGRAKTAQFEPATAAAAPEPVTAAAAKASTRDMQVGSNASPRTPQHRDSFGASQTTLQSRPEVLHATGGLRSKDCVEVTLTKSQEPGCERFGFANVPTRDNRALVISWVDVSGLLQTKWNQTVDQSQHVTEGDMIICCNGIQNDVEAMRAQLQADTVCLVIQRAMPSQGRERS